MSAWFTKNLLKSLTQIEKQFDSELERTVGDWMSGSRFGLSGLRPVKLNQVTTRFPNFGDTIREYFRRNDRKKEHGIMSNQQPDEWFSAFCAFWTVRVGRVGMVESVGSGRAG